MTSKDGIIMKNKKLAVANNKLSGSFFRYTLVMTSLISMFLMSLATVNAADLQSIGYSSLPGDKAQIVLTFSDQIETPNSFSIDEPARVVLDFAGVHNKLDKKTQEINIGLTRSVSTIEAGERTRLVINLSQKAPYTIEQDGNVVLVTIDGGAKQVAQDDTAGMAVTDIDFRRGDLSEARLMIDLSAEGSAIDVHQEQGNIVVELINVSLPENLHRRLDVIDFATPVQFIDSEQRGRNTRLTLSTKGDFEQLAYQSGKTLVIEVNPV